MTTYKLKQVKTSESFVGLSDTPATLAGGGGKILKVNSSGTGIVLADESKLALYEDGVFQPPVDGINVVGISVDKEENGIATLSGVGLPLANLQVGEVIAIDPVSKRAKGTGIVSNEKGVSVGADGVIVGQHRISSIGEAVGVTNVATGGTTVSIGMPLSSTGQAKPTYISFTSALTEVVRNADVTNTIKDPEWYVGQPQLDEVLFGITIKDVVYPQSNVYLYGFGDGKELFKVLLGDFVAGTNTFVLSTPVVIKNVNSIQVALLSDYGSVYVKGNSSGVPAYSAKLRTFEYKQLISELGIKQTVGGTPISANNLVFPSASVFVDNVSGDVVVDTSFGVDDETTSIQGVGSLKFKGATVKSTTSSNGEVTAEVTIPPPEGITINSEGSTLTNVGEINLLPPLKVSNDNTGSARIAIDHNAYQQMLPPSHLAYLTEEVSLVGKIGDQRNLHTGAIWFDDIITQSGDIYTSRDEKVYGIQEVDGLDPNITGGNDFLIAYKLCFDGVAPADGIVRIALADPTTGDYLVDANGFAMVAQRQYVAGEVLGELLVVGVVRATAITPFKCLCLDNFQANLLTIKDRGESTSGLMIQCMLTNGKTGEAIKQFELDTGSNIAVDSHYFGNIIDSLAYVSSQSMPATTIPALTGIREGDGWFLNNTTSVTLSSGSGLFKVSSSGQNTAYFSLGKIFNADKTQLLRNKELSVISTLGTPDCGFLIKLAYWTGAPDECPSNIFTGSLNDNPVLAQGWNLLSDSIPCPEDVVNEYNTLTGSFVVPPTANNFAILIYPVSQQNPLNLTISKFEIGAVDPFTGYYVKDSKLVSEQHLYKDINYNQLYMNSEGYSALRYTINSTPVTGLPMPVGHVGKGSAGVTIDRSINHVSGFNGEGAIKFNTDGNVTISTQLRVYAGESVPAGTMSSVTFWYSTVSSTGVFTKIADSETTFNVTGGDKVPLSILMKKFKLSVKAGDRIALFAKAAINDGAYIQAEAGSPSLITTDIVYSEYVPVNVPAVNDVFRAVYLTGTASDITQQLAANNTPLTAIFSAVQLASQSVSLNTATGVITFNREGSYNLSLLADVRVALTGSVLSWAVFLETSTDNGATWTAVDGSTRRLVFDGQNANDQKSANLIMPIKVVVGQLFRVRHVTTASNRQVSIVSRAASGGAPSSAGLILGISSVYDI
jgi:hypothetical protein